MIKGMNNCIIGVPEGKERHKGAKGMYEEIMKKKNCPNLMKALIHALESLKKSHGG